MGLNPAETETMYWDGKEQGACKEYGGVSLVDPKYPAICVSWLDAVKFANKLSELEGLKPCYSIKGEEVSWPEGLSCEGYRLPTEAEWEYAARAGTGSVYAGTSEEESVCRYGNVADASAKVKWTHWTIPFSSCEDGYATLAPVGKFQPNAWGLYDMSGNVWEWAWDWYGDYTGSSTDPSSGSYRVAHSGSWNNRLAKVRVAIRGNFEPTYCGFGMGFRLAKSSEPGHP